MGSLAEGSSKLVVSQMVNYTIFEMSNNSRKTKYYAILRFCK